MSLRYIPDPLSDAVSAISAVISAETAARVAKDDQLSGEISALQVEDNVLSQAISVVSQAISVEAGVRSAADVGLSNTISALKVSTPLGNVLLSGFIDLTQTSAPVTAPVSAARLYAVDDNAHTRIQYRTSDGTVIELARDAVWIVKNTQGAPITRGQIVYISGGVGASGTAEVKLAQADSLTTLPAIGIVIEASIANNGFGHILITGKADQLDTSAFLEGALLYVDATTAGAMTATVPGAPGFKQRVAVVLASHATQGSLMFMPTAKENDQWGNIRGTLANQTDLQDALSALSQGVSATSQALSSQAAALSVRIDTQSQGISVLSQQVSVLSQAHSALSQSLSSQAAALSVRIDTQSQGVSVLSQQVSVISQALSALINRVSGNSATGGGGSVTSTELSAAVAVETSNRISADNALSQAISIISQQVSALSQVVSAMSDRVSGISAILSTLRGGTTGQVLKKSTASDFNWTWAADVTGGAGSVDVTSQHFSVISQQVSVLSQALSSQAAALSVRIDTQSQGISVISQQVSALSQAHSALSQAHSVLSQAVSALSAIATPVVTIQNVDGSAVSAGAPVYAFTSANTFKRANASAIATKAVLGLVIDANIAVSATGRVQTRGLVTLTTGQWDSITGQVGGLTIGSLYYLDVTAGLLTTTAPTTGAVRAVGVALSTTQMELRIGQADDVTSALSTLSTAASNALSVANAASNAASVVSQALSSQAAALSVRIDTQSQGISVLSQQISVISQQVSVLSQAHSALSQVVSALSQSLSSQAAALSVRIDTQSQGISVLSQQVSALSQAHSALSQAVSVISVQVASALSIANAASNAASVVSQALSVEIANRVSAVNVVSQGVSVLSQQVSIISQQVSAHSQTLSFLSAIGAVAVLQNVDGSAISAGAPVYAFTSANTIKRANASAVGTKPVIGLVIDTAIAVSATGRVQTAGLVTLTTGQWDSITGQVGGLTAGSLYYLDVTTGLLTATAPTTGAVRLVGIALSTTVMQLQIGAHDDTTSALSTLSTAISAETANRISAINVVSQGVSVLSQQVSVLSQAHSALSQAVSVISVQVASALSIANAASNAASVVSQALSVETANRVSAVNVVSQAVSVISQQVSALSQVVSAMSDRVSGISAILSTLRGGTTGQVLKKSTASDFNWTWAADITGGAGSVDVTSQHFSALSQQVSALSQTVSVDKAALSVRIDTQSQSISVISQQVSALSQFISALGTMNLQNVDGSAVSAGAPVYLFTSANTFKQANASALGGAANLVVGLVADGSIAISAVGKIRFAGILTLTTGQWDAITGDVGGLVAGTMYWLGVAPGTLTKTEPANTVAQRPVGVALSTTDMKLMISATNALSSRLSALSAALSTTASALSQQISIISQQVSILSQTVSVISAGLGGMQMRFLAANNAVLTGSAISNVSGLSISCAANGAYQIEARLVFNISAISAVGFGLSYPNLTYGSFVWEGNMSAAVASNLSTTGWFRTYVMESAAQANTNAVHLSLPAMAASAGFTYRVDLEGMLVASAAGTLQVVAKQLTNGIVMLKGSFIRAYKIA